MEFKINLPELNIQPAGAGEPEIFNFSNKPVLRVIF